MSVEKIFKVLIIVVACVIIGALVLNVLLPNTTKSLVNAVEDQVHNATGLTFDFNGDGNSGDKNENKNYTGDAKAKQLDADGQEKNAAGVAGWSD